jgi:hypothetical protein
LELRIDISRPILGFGGVMSLTKSCCSTVLLLIVAALPVHSAVLSYLSSRPHGYLNEVAFGDPSLRDYGSFFFPGFNPALGTLNLVLIEQEITSKVVIDLQNSYPGRFVGNADVVIETFGPTGGGLLMRLGPAAFFDAEVDPPGPMSNHGIFHSFGYASGSATTCCAPFVSASDWIELPYVGYPLEIRIEGSTPLYGFITEYRVDTTLSYFYTPVPEPSTWSMLLLALILFGLRKWCALSRSRT